MLTSEMLSSQCRGKISGHDPKSPGTGPEDIVGPTWGAMLSVPRGRFRVDGNIPRNELIADEVDGPRRVELLMVLTRDP